MTKNNTVVAVQGEFSKGLGKLASKGAHIMSAEERVKTILREGENSMTYRTPSFISNGGIVCPKGQIYFTKKSPILDDPSLAGLCSFCGEGYDLSGKQIAESLKHASLVDRVMIPSSDLHLNGATSFLFGKYAQAFGKYLEARGIPAIDIVLPEDKRPSDPYAFQLFFDNNVLDCTASLDANYRQLLGLK
jgi:hypothetical protein